MNSKLDTTPHRPLTISIQSSPSLSTLQNDEDASFLILIGSLFLRLFFFSFFSLFQKELEDLAAFEMLEEAACDSSFSSSSSKVKHLMGKPGRANASTNANVLPSPIVPPAKSATSTPIAPGKTVPRQGHLMRGRYCFYIDLIRNPIRSKI